MTIRTVCYSYTKAVNRFIHNITHNNSTVLEISQLEVESILSLCSH